MSTLINRVVKNASHLNSIHWLVLFFSVCLTIGAWHVSKSYHDRKVEQEFEYQVITLKHTITDRMAHYADVLRGGAALYKSHQHDVDAKTWSVYANSLNIEGLYPGINGLGFIYHVEEGELSNFIREQKQLRPDFHVHPEHSNPEHWPITYIEPVEDNLSAMGLDIAFETNRYTAAVKARDTHTTQVTGPITLVQDAEKTPGFLIYYPVFKNKGDFVGHVYAPFIMNKLMKGTLQGEHRQLIFNIFDQGQLLYHGIDKGQEDYDETPMFSKGISLSMYGRVWDITVNSTTGFRDKVKSLEPAMILAGGVVVDTLLFLLFINLVRAKRTAEGEVVAVSLELKKSEEFFRHVVETAPCGLVVADSNGKIELVNTKLSAMLGYKAQDFYSLSINDLVSSRDSGWQDRLSEKNLADHHNINPDEILEVSLVSRTGAEIPAEITMSHFKEDGDPKVLFNVIDISNTKKTNNELLRSNKDLDDFAYVASHDLKAPLRGIMQLSSWIEEDVKDSINDETRENFVLLNNRVERLERLLNDLLDYSRVNKNVQLAIFKEFDTRKHVEELFILLAPPEDFSLVCAEGLPVFKANIVPLELVFRNLINNAIKHHDKNAGVISISCEENNTHYIFSVADDGAGIGPEHYEKIFNIFQTLKPRDEVEGSGMGLAMIKRIIDNQNSTITVKPNHPRGVIFEFTWPKSTLAD